MTKMERNKDLSLNSAYFVAFEMLRDSLSGVLREQGDLNVTQYRLLLKAYETSRESKKLSDLASTLRLQPNVVTQATNVLEKKRLVRRASSNTDARAKSLILTDTGVEQISCLNKALNERLYSTFNPTSDPLYKTMLEAAIIAGTYIETSLEQEFSKEHAASATLTTFLIIEQNIEDALHDVTGVSFNECRILQRLAEVNEPMRGVDLASQLALIPTTITRAATRLEKKGLVCRLASPDNRQAVFLDTTDEGQKIQKLLIDEIDRVAEEYFWSKLDSEHQDAIDRIGDVFIENMRKRDDIRRQERFSTLTVIPPKH
jgi:DNA-binding MarR family transcriptional regulator